MPSAPCRGAAATSSPVPSQEAAADAAAAPAGGTPVATLLCVQSQQCKRALLTRRASQSSSTGKGAPISAKALRQFFGLKPAQSSETLNKSVPPKQGAPLVGARQKVEQCAAEKLNSFPGDFSGVSQGAEKGSDALSADAATADSAAKIYGAAASAGVSPTLNVGLPCLRPQPASSVVEQCQMAISAEKSAANVSVQVPPKAGGLTHVFNWRHKRRITPYSLSGTASATNEADFNSSEGQTKLQRTGIAASESSPDRFCAGIIPNACGSSGVDTTKQERTGSSRALQQADAVLRKVAAVRAVEPTTASATTPHATCMIWGSGRENTAKAPTAPAPAPPVGRDFGSAYPARLTRPWVDLPEPLILHVLDYGGKEFATSEHFFLMLLCCFCCSGCCSPKLRRAVVEACQMDLRRISFGNFEGFVKVLSVFLCLALLLLLLAQLAVALLGLFAVSGGSCAFPGTLRRLLQKLLSRQ